MINLRSKIIVLRRVNRTTVTGLPVTDIIIIIYLNVCLLAYLHRIIKKYKKKYTILSKLREILEYLIKEKLIIEDIIQGEVGRPKRVYSIIE